MKTPNEMPSTPRAFAYIRFSTEEQRKGDSLNRQTVKAQAFARSHGLASVDVETYVDAGVSAYRGANDTKGMLGKFIARAKSGEIRRGDWLIIENLDRLSRRNVEDAYSLLTSITNTGVLVGVCDDGQIYRKGGFDQTTIIRWVISQELAHQESKKKSERCCRAWATKRANLGTRKLTAKCPGWLELSADKTTFRVIKHHAATVRRIFKETSGGRGLAAISNMLNAEKVPPFKWAEGWAAATIAGVLRSRAVLGEFSPCKMNAGKREEIGEPIKDYFPRIISNADFYAAEAVIKARRNNGGRAVSSCNNLFTRACVCGQCGGPVHYVNKGGGLVHLRCDRAARRLTTCKPSHWSYRKIEGAFLRWVVGFDFSGTSESARSQKMAELEAARAESEIAATKIARLTEAMATSPLPVATFYPQLEKAKAEADRLAESAERLTAELHTMRSQVATIDAAKMAENPDNRFRLREEIKRRIKRLVMFPKFARVELPDGREIDLIDEKTVAVDVLGKGRKTRFVDPHRLIPAAC